ncbi:hypothetical protein Tco_0788712 [Tanacetum coccineum]
MNNNSGALLEIIIIQSDTSSSFGSSRSNEYDSSSSFGSSSYPHKYEIVSSKSPYKYLLKWYDDTTDEDIPEFKFLKRKVKDDDDRSDEYFQVKVKQAKTCKGKSSKSSSCKTKGFKSSKTKVVSKPKTVKSPLLDSSDEDMSKSSKSTGCKTKSFNSSKTKVVSKPKTVKIPFLDSSDEDMSKSSKSQAKTLKSPFLDSSDDDIPNSFKSQAKTSKGKASYSTTYKTRASTSSKSKGVPQAITLKSLVAQPIILIILIAIKNCVIGLANGKT